MITYYPSNNSFEARCFRHQGDRCTLRRNAGKRAASSSDMPGNTRRPVGLLAAWLQVSHLCENKDKHKDPAMMKSLAGRSQQQFRADCRRAFALLPGADDLLAKEGDADAGEPEIAQ